MYIKDKQLKAQKTSAGASLKGAQRVPSKLVLNKSNSLTDFTFRLDLTPLEQWFLNFFLYYTKICIEKNLVTQCNENMTRDTLKKVTVFVQILKLRLK